MTRLDRLEALAEKQQSPVMRLYDGERLELLNALPDLIRVARAAQIVRVGREPVFGAITLIGLADLETALAPLYREMESDAS